MVQLYKSRQGVADSMELVASQKLPTSSTQELRLKIEAHGGTYSFLFSSNANEWKLLKDNVDATFLSTKTAGGFVGCLYALYATSLGRPSENVAYYNWFEYQGDDDVYKD